jgi:hypothetical protein
MQFVLAVEEEEGLELPPPVEEAVGQVVFLLVGLTLLTHAL